MIGPTQAHRHHSQGVVMSVIGATDRQRESQELLNTLLYQRIRTSAVPWYSMLRPLVSLQVRLGSSLNASLIIDDESCDLLG